LTRRRVAIDDGLEYYRPILQSEGFEVLDLDGPPGLEADAILLSGMDGNTFGRTVRSSSAFTMDVNGRQPEEVIYDLNKHFNLRSGEATTQG
jgi:hypothetical protein